MNIAFPVYMCSHLESDRVHSVKVCYEKQKSTDSYNTFYFHSIPSVVVEEKFPSQLDDIFFFFFLIYY